MIEKMKKVEIQVLIWYKTNTMNFIKRKNTRILMSFDLHDEGDAIVWSTCTRSGDLRRLRLKDLSGSPDGVLQCRPRWYSLVATIDKQPSGHVYAPELILGGEDGVFGRWGFDGGLGVGRGWPLRMLRMCRPLERCFVYTSGGAPRPRFHLSFHYIAQGLQRFWLFHSGTKKRIGLVELNLDFPTIHDNI